MKSASYLPMISVFHSDNANDLWLRATNAIVALGESATQAGRGGPTRELLHVVFGLTNPRNRWITGRLPSVNPAFVIAETIWLLAGENASAFLNYWNRKLPDYAGHGSFYHGAYGFRLRSHFGRDQLRD